MRGRKREGGRKRGRKGVSTRKSGRKRERRIKDEGRRKEDEG